MLLIFLSFGGLMKQAPKPVFSKPFFRLSSDRASFEVPAGFLPLTAVFLP